MKKTQPRAAVIHSFAGLGKCSLTVFLPVLSAMGCAVSALPTAVLSTHTGFPKPVVRPMTDLLVPAAAHWARVGARFDGLALGYLAGEEQLSAAEGALRLLREKNPGMTVLLDPVMGDNGRLYALYSGALADRMARLAGTADVLTPNFTEAYRLLGEPYRPGPYPEEEVRRVLRGLCGLGAKRAVLTGVSPDAERIGAAFLDSDTGEEGACFAAREPQNFHGTGDLFAAVLFGGLLRGEGLSSAVRRAVDFTAACIRETVERVAPEPFGVCFELLLGRLTEETECTTPN